VRARPAADCVSIVAAVFRPEPAVYPEPGEPFSLRNLVAFLRQGAARPRWEGRDPRPAARVGGWSEQGWPRTRARSRSSHPCTKSPPTPWPFRWTGCAGRSAERRWGGAVRRGVPLHGLLGLAVTRA